MLRILCIMLRILAAQIITGGPLAPGLSIYQQFVRCSTWRYMPWLGPCHSTLMTARAPRLIPTRTSRLGLCHNTLTPARTPRLVWQHLDTSRITKAWAVSQYTDTSKNTKACVRTHWHQQEHQGLGCVPGLLQTMTGKVILTQTFFHQLQTR